MKTLVRRRGYRGLNWSEMDYLPKGNEDEFLKHMLKVSAEVRNGLFAERQWRPEAIPWLCVGIDSPKWTICRKAMKTQRKTIKPHRIRDVRNGLFAERQWRRIRDCPDTVEMCVRNGLFAERQWRPTTAENNKAPPYRPKWTICRKAMKTRPLARRLPLRLSVRNGLFAERQWRLTEPLTLWYNHNN